MNEIINGYITGEKTLEEANDALVSIGAGVKLDPERNTIKPGEEADYGLLDTGTGTLDKVKISGGRLVSCDCGSMPARVYFRGRCFEIHGDRLTL